MQPIPSERLKFIRERAGGISQQKLADAIKVPVSRIKDVESGKNNITVDLGLKLEAFSNLSFKWILSGEGEPLLETQEADSSHGAKAFDASLLKRIIIAIEKELTDRGLALAPDKKAEAIALLYELYAGTKKEVTEETIERYLKLVA